MNKIDKFVECLKDIMLEENTTLEILIKESSVPRNNLYSYLRNTSLPNVKNLIKLSNYFNCSIDYLLGLSSTRNITNSTKNENFNLRLNYVIKKNCKSLNEFLSILELPNSTYYSWKYRNTFPNYEMLIKIASNFDVSIDYLLGRSDY